MPALTVILPVHNGENYLGEAIGSVLSQSFQDFELHVLDDASEDASARIAQSTGDRRVRYSRNPERFGLFKTLNRGFKEANTRWVRVWAHDDRMVADALAAFMRFVTQHPEVGMCYCDFYSIDANGRRTGVDAKYLDQRSRTPEVASPSLSALLFWCFGCLPGNISTTMVRRDVWHEAGGFATGKQQAPDYDMWVRIGERWPIGFLKEKLVDLRDHPLQLGKLGQKLMTTIEEELPVVRRLEASLRLLVPEKALRRHWMLQRGRQHMHWIARALLRGDPHTAARGWRVLADYGGSRWAQALFWLGTLNGRLASNSNARLFDAWRDRCGPRSEASLG